MSWRLSLVVTVVSAVAVAERVRGEENSQGDQAALPHLVSYYRDVRPILQQNCQGCHQPAKRLGGYAMLTHADLLAAGESGEVGVVPGKPDESGLLFQISPAGDDPPAMPKGRDPLTDQQVALIRKWIEQGAKDDTPEVARTVVDTEHPPVYQREPVITSIAYSPDGTLLAVSGFHEVILHRGDGSGIVARLVGLAERVQSLAFSPDGTMLAVTGGSPGRFGEVQIWDVAKRTLKQSISMTYDTIYGASWSHDGKLLAFGCADNTVRAIDASTGEQVLFQGAHDDWVLDTTFSAKNTHVISVSRDRSMKLTEVATQRFVDNITSITPGALKGGLLAVDVHPANDEVVIGGADGTPKIYQIFRTQARRIGDDFNLIRAFEPMPGRIFDVRYSADGTKIVAASSSGGSGQVRVYQTADGKLISKFEGQKGGVFAVSFHKDGKLVASAGFDGMVRINEVETGKLIKEFVPIPLQAAATVTAAVSPQ